jgi:hypothetical protein
MGSDVKPFESTGLKGAAEEAWQSQTRMREALLNRASPSADLDALVEEPTLRTQIIAAIMALIKTPATPVARPSLEELERILNSETADEFNILPDGTVERMTTTTVGAVADAVIAIIDARQSDALTALQARLGEVEKALTERIDYHDVNGSMAEAADMPESAAHHDAVRKELEAIRATLQEPK